MKLLLFVLLSISYTCYGQKDTSLKYVYDSKFASAFPSYPDKDTLPCLFYVVYDFKYPKPFLMGGFVERVKGGFKFGANGMYNSTTVTEAYLPITSGIVQSKVFYSDMREVKETVIQLILIPKK